MTHDFSGRFRVGLERLPSWLWGKSGNSGKTSNGTFIPVEYFCKKGNTFRGITFFPLSPDLPKFSVPFVWIIRASTFCKNFSQPAISDLLQRGLIRGW